MATDYNYVYEYTAQEAMEGTEDKAFSGFNEEAKAFDIEAKALRGGMSSTLGQESGSYNFDYEDDKNSEFEEPDMMEYYDYDEDETYDKYSVVERMKRKENILNLYSAEGFEYVRTEEVGEYKEENIEANKFDKSSLGSLTFDGPVARVTTKGDVYTAPSSAGMMANDKDEVKRKLKPIREQQKKSSFPPNFEKNDGVQGDLIIGRDTRFQVPLNLQVAGWPSWRVVRVGNGCSGTIVGWNKVLTNAHCVYSRTKKQWTVPRTVTPGQNGSARWGSWNVRHATILSAYINNDSHNHQKYDYAILTIKNDNWTRKHIGQYMGYFPMQDVSCAVLDQENYKKRIVGYPGDKPSGTMWDAGQCDAWRYSCGSKHVYHKCDIWFGSSGSGMLLFYSNWSIRVIGVHAFGTYDSVDGWNSGPAFEGGVASMLRRW